MKPILRLGFHYHVPAIQTPQGIRVPGYLGRFMDSLAEQCDLLACFLQSSSPNESSMLDYTLQSRNVEWIDIGPRTSVPKRLLSSRLVRQKVRAWQERLDVLMIRGPTPLLPTIARGIGQVPIVLLLVGDNLASVDDIKQPTWRKELIRAFWRWNKFQQMRVAQRALTFVNSRILYDELKHRVPYLKETRTTTLSENDFYQRQNTCVSPPYHLLYTGRMDRTKGVLDMVEALALLVRRGEDVVLDLVGWPAAGDTILDEIQILAQIRGVADRVKYHGFKSLGAELFSCYRMADVYVIASQSSEGFPRTIWEAMAHSVPVVATRVGSIPNYVEDVAVLVEPRQPQELAVGITHVLHSLSARQEMIQRGRQLVRSNTLEAQTSTMVQEIMYWLKNHE